MAYNGQFFAIYSDGTSALAASERELAGLRGDRTEAVAGHAEALDADPELLAAFERASETPEARGERLASATVDELAAELLAGGDRAAVVEAIATKASVEKAEIEAEKIESEKATDPKAVRTLSGALVAEELPMLAPPPPPDKPVERRESSLARAWRRGVWEQPWPIKALALGIIGATTAGLVLAVLATVGVVDDGAEPPVNAGSVADVFHVCPSEPTPLEAWQADAARWNTHGCRITVLADPCAGPPQGGVIQIRGGGDVPEGFAPPDESDHPNGTFSSPDGFPVVRGVIYDYSLDSGGRVHELGHALGWLDADRMPTSIMHPAGEGLSWEGLGCPIDTDGATP